MSYNEETHARLVRIEDVLLDFSNNTNRPFACLDENNVRRVFYAKPTLINYIILSMARSISGFRAAFKLYEFGFFLESMTLLRSVIENQSRLHYVLAGISVRKIDKISEDFVRNYFSDTKRSMSERAGHTYLSQKDIHRRIAKAFRLNAESLKSVGVSTDGLTEAGYSENLSRLYNIFSNFSHGRYTEAMTLYGYNSLELKFTGNLESRDKELEDEFFNEVSSLIEKDMKLSVLKALAIDPNIRLKEASRNWVFSGIF